MLATTSQSPFFILTRNKLMSDARMSDHNSTAVEGQLLGKTTAHAALSHVHPRKDAIGTLPLRATNVNNGKQNVVGGQSVKAVRDMALRVGVVVNAAMPAARIGKYDYHHLVLLMLTVRSRAKLTKMEHNIKSLQEQVTQSFAINEPMREHNPHAAPDRCPYESSDASRISGSSTHITPEVYLRPQNNHNSSDLQARHLVPCCKLYTAKHGLANSTTRNRGPGGWNLRPDSW